MRCKCKDRLTFGALNYQGLCHLCSAADTTKKIFRKQNSEKKIKIFGLWKNTYHTIFLYGKMFMIEISYNFLYVWNCMIRSFGHPGQLISFRDNQNKLFLFILQQ